MTTKEKVQYIFIYLTLILFILAVFFVITIIVYNILKWSGYRKDENKKVFVDRIEKMKEILENNKTIDNYIGIGNDYYNLEEYSLAVSSYKKAIKIGGGSLVYSNIGNIYKDMGKYEKAEESYLQSLEISPRQPDIYIKLFELYKIPWKNRLYSPDAILEKGLSEMPDDPNILINLADYCRDMGEKERAIGYYRRALGTQPDNDTIKEELTKLIKQ